MQQLRTAFGRDGAEMTDGELLTLFLNSRDDAAFAALVQRHAQMVWGVCHRLLRSHHDAEDAFQATFLVLVRKAASVVPREAVGNWLYGVAQQTAVRLRAMAAKKGGRERQMVDMPETVVEDASSNAFLPLLDQELSCLPEKYRALVVLCDLESKTRKEVARQFGIPEGTVAGRLARARAMLAKRLARRGVTVSGGLLAAALPPSAASGSAPAALVASTIKAASLMAAGQAVSTGLISAKVVALTEGMVKAMFATTFKSLLAVVLVVGVILGGLGVGRSEFNKSEAVAQQPAAKPDEPKTPAVKDEKNVPPENANENEKDGLSVVIKPTKPSFRPDEPLALKVTYRNVSKDPLPLPAHPGDFRYAWELQLDNVDTGKSYTGRYKFPSGGYEPPKPTDPIQPKQALEEAVEFKMFLFAEGKFVEGKWDRTKAHALPAGKYKVRVVLRFPLADGNFAKPNWTGNIKTNTVEFEVSDKPLPPEAKIAKPQVFTGTIKKPQQDALKVATVIGRHGVLLIRSDARWDEFKKLAPDLTPDAPLPKLDFAKQSVILIIAMGDSSNNSLSLDKSDLTANPPDLGFSFRWYNGPVAGLELPSIKFIYAVIPATPVVKVALTSQPTHVDRFRIVTEFSALLGGKDGGDIVDGLQSTIATKAATIKPGEDILIDFALYLADPGKAKPEHFGTMRKSVLVWDGKYSNGYRNHAFFVTTPDGTTTLLRPKVIADWDKNAPHPVAITAKGPYHLPNWIEGETLKSLKSLGLDTTTPGTYTITGLYEESDKKVGNEDGKMWGGSITSNTISVEVKK